MKAIIFHVSDGSRPCAYCGKRGADVFTSGVVLEIVGGMPNLSHPNIIRARYQSLVHHGCLDSLKEAMYAEYA